MTVIIRINLSNYSQSQLIRYRNEGIITTEELCNELKERGYTEYDVLMVSRKKSA